MGGKQHAPMLATKAVGRAQLEMWLCRGCMHMVVAQHLILNSLNSSHSCQETACCISSGGSEARQTSWLSLPAQLPPLPIRGCSILCLAWQISTFSRTESYISPPS